MYLLVRILIFKVFCYKSDKYYNKAPYIVSGVVTVPEVEGSAVLSPTNMPPPLTGWRYVSAGPGEEVWAISSSGIVCRRHGITKDNPAGTTWSHGVVVSSTRAQKYFLKKNVTKL